ncbi:DMT family transporter [Tropicimonas aquimaris]|uniref:DMT family transporter n=1 Tax=Tropicimonas aquimaris TaxID=914152 RepID=A0ABW3IMX1_9RHOB
MTALSDNLRGALFMTAAMAAFALEDTFLKSATVTMAVGQALMLLGLFGTAGFVLLGLVRGEPVADRRMIHPRMWLRAAFEACGRIFYTLAIAMAPLSNATAILQATPIVVVAGAAMFMGEQVGWRRWLAILAGFAGVLMILRPGLSGFDSSALLAFLGMLGFAGRDLATRAAPKGLTNAQIGICGYSILVPTGALLLVVTGNPLTFVATGIGHAALASLCSVAAYTGLTAAMRMGEVSAVTPFRYTRLLFGVGLGMAVFSERPDAMTIAGSAVILAAGLYIMLRESGLRRR